MHLEDNVLTLQPCEEPAVTWTMGKVKAGCLGKAAPTPPPPSALLHHRSFSLPPSFLLSTSHAVSPSISFAQVLKHLQIPFML